MNYDECFQFSKARRKEIHEDSVNGRCTLCKQAQKKGEQGWHHGTGYPVYFYNWCPKCYPKAFTGGNY